MFVNCFFCLPSSPALEIEERVYARLWGDYTYVRLCEIDGVILRILGM